MEIGLALPQFDFSVPGESRLPWETVLTWAEEAEAAGFHSLWLADHIFLGIEKYGGPAGDYDGYDPLVALAALARRTARARLGTLVLCAQLRPPSLLAKALATLDRLSGGRLVIGIGAGWYEPEYRAAGIPFERPGVRLEQLREAVDVLRGLFAGGPFTYRGDHYGTDDARCLPTPAQQPAPPIWVGGRGDRLIDVAARHADGWNTVWTWTPAAYRERVAVLTAACERAGRDPATVTRSLGLFALVGEDGRDLERRWSRLQEATPKGVVDSFDLDGWREGHLVGTVEQVQEQLAEWEELGVDTLVLGAGALPFAVVDADDLAVLSAACRLRTP